MSKNTYINRKHVFKFGSQLWHQIPDGPCLLVPLEIAKHMEKVSVHDLRSPLFEFATE